MLPQNFAVQIGSLRTSLAMTIKSNIIHINIDGNLNMFFIFYLFFIFLYIGFCPMYESPNKDNIITLQKRASWLQQLGIYTGLYIQHANLIGYYILPFQHLQSLYKKR